MADPDVADETGPGKETAQFGGRLAQVGAHPAPEAGGLVLRQAFHRGNEVRRWQVLDHAARALAALILVVVQEAV